MSDCGLRTDGGSVSLSGGPARLPGTGAGPMSDSGIALYWALAAGAIGVASLAIGTAVRRRVRSIER